MVDTISSLGSIDYRHDEWGVDVTVAGSQKGLMLPPGLSFNAIAEKAIAASKTAKMPRCYWRWDEMLEANRNGFFPYTPATNLFYGLRKRWQCCRKRDWRMFSPAPAPRGSDSRRGARLGPGGVARIPANTELADRCLRAARATEADRLRALFCDNFNMSLGAGLAKLAGKVFRIGHLGSFNDLMLAGTLSGVEMGLQLAGVPHREGGVTAALQSLARIETPAPSLRCRVR